MGQAKAAIVVGVVFKAFPVLIVGIALAMWGRSITSDDRIALGLKEAGRLQLRSTSGAVSLSANAALVKLGRNFAVETSFQKITPVSAEHSGLNFSFKKPMQWELRVPWWGIALLAGAWLFLRARMTRE